MALFNPHDDTGDAMDEAEQAFALVLARYPRHAPARAYEGLIALERGRQDAADVAFREALAVGALAGCSATAQKSADVSDAVRAALDQAGLKTVTVSQDRDKGIVTLGGQVASEGDKAQAETLARSLAGAQVVADQIAVVPVGAGKDAKTVNSDLDKGIEVNLEAALIQNKMHDTMKYDVKNAVVTLTGEVISPLSRDDAQSVAERVPNVKQVVNSLQVKNQKATSSR